MEKVKWSRVKCENSNKRWIEEEECRLEVLWGKNSVETIAKLMGRSEKAIIGRARILGLGAFFDNGFYTAREVARIVGVPKATVLKWIKEKDLKAIRKHKISRKIYQITTENLYNWLRDNQDLWNASKLDYMALGKEEYWLEAKRKKDDKFKKRCIPYSKKEDEKIKRMYLSGFSDKEISEKTGRTVNGIKRRLKILRKRDNLPFRYVVLQEQKRAS